MNDPKRRNWAEVLFIIMRARPRIILPSSHPGAIPHENHLPLRRARHMGITPPIQARRLRDGYLLTDGLYRLRAAEALGLEKIPALVE